MHITRKFWSPEFCGSYAPLNLEISRNILLKQLVSTTPLKLLNRISWNLVGSKDTICGCAYCQEILISWILWELCPFEFPEIYYDQIWNRMCRCACQISSDLRCQYFQTTRSTSEIFLWCAKSSLERLDTWHSTNSHGRFQCGPFIQKRWCNHTHIFCFWTEYKIFY